MQRTSDAAFVSDRLGHGDAMAKEISMAMVDRNVHETAGIETVLAGLTHDIRGAFGVIKMLVALAARDVRHGNGSAALEYLSRVDRAVAKATDLCNDALECGRRRAGPVSLALERVDLVALIEDCVALHAGAIEAARATVLVDLPESAFVVAHRRSVERILENVLRNALTHAARAPIEVRIDLVAGGAMVTIRDRGNGIPPELHPHLFEPWGRGSVDRAFQQFGLGLWIVKSLVESIGGALHVDSAAGRGCAIRVLVPNEPPLPTRG
jgi:signal transduction histidine kinase